MTRRRLLLMLAGGIAVALCVAWLLARPASGAGPVLTLRVGSGRTARVNAGTPLAFDVAVTARGERSISIGGFARAWHAMIALELEDGTRLRDLVPRRAGWTEVRGGPGGFDVTSGQSSRAVISPRRVHRLVIEAQPGTTESLAPGTYRVHAVLRSPFWLPWGWRGEARSAAITLEIRRGDPALEPRRLAEAAALHLRHKRAAEAEPLVRELLGLRPGMAGPLVLAGDLDAALGRWSEALARYQEALARTPPAREEPDLLYARISWARAKLAEGAPRPASEDRR